MPPNLPSTKPNMSYESDDLARALDEEIQFLHQAIQTALRGQPNKRPLWASDRSVIGDTLPIARDGHPTTEALAALMRVESILGITIDERERWTVVARRLRDAIASAR